MTVMASKSVVPLPRLLRSLPFAVALLVPYGGIVLAAHPGAWLGWGLPVIIFMLIPLLDPVMGLQEKLLEDDKAATMARDWRYDLWLWAWVPMQMAGLVIAVLSIRRGGIAPVDFALFVVGMSCVTGIGINVAHELIHRRGKFERALAEVLMVSVTYGHWNIEHVLGHHKNVATPNDPATSRLGESFYAFLPRTLWGTLTSAWHLENARIKKLGIPWYSLKNRNLRHPLWYALIYTTVFAVAGVPGVLFWFAQGVLGACLLEVINYIEHYGLQRRELRPGVYERCMPWHSWNSSARLTNWFLFHLQRHADHHHVASRPYFALRHVDDSPQLPTGYAGMVVLALFPPLWRRVMDPRVAAWHARQRDLEETA